MHIQTKQIVMFIRMKVLFVNEQKYYLD